MHVIKKIHDPMNRSEYLCGLKIGWRCRVGCLGFMSPPSGQLVEARPLPSDSYWIVRKRREFEAHDNGRFLPTESSEFARQDAGRLAQESLPRQPLLIAYLEGFTPWPTNLPREQPPPQSPNSLVLRWCLGFPMEDPRDHVHYCRWTNKGHDYFLGAISSHPIP
jgi:hypothetical protein